MMSSHDSDDANSPQYIAVVGSSGAGKSTLLRALRASNSAKTLNFIPRFSTRPRRIDDDPHETIVIADDSFDALLEGKALALQWQRALPDGRLHRYGLPWSLESSPKVFCANVEFLASFDHLPIPKTQFAIIEVWTPRDIRLRRLLARSPELSDDQVELALRSSEIHEESRQLIDAQVDNSSDGIVPAVTRMCSIIDSLLKAAEG
jgi:ribose 1,5-bisphosphokinase PhnN